MQEKRLFVSLSLLQSLLTGSAKEEYIYSMKEQKKKKKQKKTDKKNATKIILSTDEDTAEEDLDEDEDDAGGIYLEKEDILLIYRALKNYKPESNEEDMVYEILLEQFEEILIVDYNVKLKRSGW